MRSWTRALALSVSGLLVAVGGQQATADTQKGSADAYRPAPVRNVSIVAASKHSLTLNWPSIARAGDYQVEVDTDLDMANRRLVARVDRSRFTLTGLHAGRTYCFQVRALTGSKPGKRSPRTCKPTIIAQNPTAQATYRVLTYNTCSARCKHWGERRGPALSLIRRPSPDVIALQETGRDSGVVGRLDGHFAAAEYKSAKFLLYRRDRFSMKRSGWIDLGRKHYAVWADLADKEHGGKRVIFTSAHFAAGPDDAAGDSDRRKNAHRLIAGIARINGKGLPVVYAGDFNSHKHRRFDSPATKMHEAGYWDAYDLAEKLVRPNYDSANQFRIDPVIGDTWGDHVDHVWVKPGQSRILKWRSVAEFTSAGNYAAPLPSDHNPVFVKVAVD